MESDVRDLDTAPKASADIVALNNQVVSMRRAVMRARVHVINRLVRCMRNIKAKGESERPNRKKEERKLERMKAELVVIRGLNPDRVSKYALASTTTFADVCKQPNVSEVSRAFARLADNAVLQKVVQDFRSKHPDWPSLAAFLLAKTTNRKFKKKKKKVKGQKQEVKQKVDALTLELRLKNEGKSEKDKNLQKTQINNETDTNSSNTTSAEASMFSKKDIPAWGDSSESEKDNASDSDRDNLSESDDVSDPDDVSSNKQTRSPAKASSIAVQDKQECHKSDTPSAKPPVAQSVKTNIDTLNRTNKLPEIASKTRNPIVVEKQSEEMIVKKLDLSQLPEDSEVLVKSNSKDSNVHLKAEIFGKSSAAKTGHKRDPFFQGSDDDDDEEEMGEEESEEGEDENVSSSRPLPLPRRFESTFVGALNKTRKIPNRNTKSEPRFERDNKRNTQKQPSRQQKNNSAMSNMPGSSDRASSGRQLNKPTAVSAEKKASDSLHPSWEASKIRKQQQSAVHAFQGKRIKFDDSD